ncbi:MAG: hypothetical protein FJ206_01915 [Gemmatimonadetes bacterium]|nr:hypothetical protein [Gemmatimonadota bacterium]
MGVLLVLLQAVSAPVAVRTQASDSVPFARLVEQLSEPGGYFDTDNLISNESSYLHILGRVKAQGVKGGAYVGVGPDQNFSYITAVRPSVAFIVDLRRDNLLLHLLFKSLFEASRNRLEFLALLFGRPAPQTLASWNNRPLSELLDYIAATPADTARHRRTHAQLADRIRGYGLPAAMVDHPTIRRFHDEFVRAGLGLRFTSYGRGPRTYYPTIRQLYLERDLSGREASFLATEENFRFLQSLQRRGRVVPIVGDFGGTRAFREMGRFLTEGNLAVSLFYTSNVEFYVFRQGAFRRYVDNVNALPWARNGLIARSYFGGVLGQSHPQARPGYASVQLVQTAESFRRRTAQPDSVSYWELVTQDALPLTP